MLTHRCLLLPLLVICLTGCAGTHDFFGTRMPWPHRDTVDDTVGETSVCQVHHIQMVRTTVPIEYGLPVWTPQAQARYAASTNAFPRAETFILGGCIVEPNFPRKAVIYMCTECLKAAQTWDATYEKTHPK